MATFNRQLGIDGNHICLEGFYTVEAINQPWDEMDRYAKEIGEGEFNRSGGAISRETSRIYIFTDQKTAALFKLCFGGR